MDGRQSSSDEKMGDQRMWKVRVRSVNVWPIIQSIISDLVTELSTKVNKLSTEIDNYRLRHDNLVNNFKIID